MNDPSFHQEGNKLNKIGNSKTIDKNLQTNSLYLEN